MRLAKKEDVILEPISIPGPTAIIRGEYNDNVKDVSLKIVSRYTSQDENVDIRIKKGEEELSCVSGNISEKALENLRV